MQQNAATSMNVERVQRPHATNWPTIRCGKCLSMAHWAVETKWWLKYTRMGQSGSQQLISAID